tara:strand:+ start:12272 stop:12535 length:264 start_codon:yes stop_codon:yes gene_type:complete
MLLFSLDQLTSEQQAIDIADRLVDEAIEASTAQRNKRRKIRAVEAKIKRVQKKCLVMQWSKPIEKLKRSFEMLEEMRGELDVQMWGI